MIAASAAASLSIGLLHYPVYDRNRQVVTTAITNLDLHDIARSARTYDLDRYYVITPVSEQRNLAERIKSHWLEGWGAGYNPKRKAALELLQVVESLDVALADLKQRHGTGAKLIVTGAQGRPGNIDFSRLQQMLVEDRRPHLLLLGTGWGMTEDVFDRADHVLEPIRGGSDYNHLSVRSAAAIMLDRLFGR